jgi:hypothetical protein
MTPPKASPVLFTDIDGVYNSDSYYRRLPPKTYLGARPDPEHFDPLAVSLLNKVVDATGCRVVVTSNWRLHHTQNTLNRFLAQAGWRGTLYGVTPDLSRGWFEHGPRHEEIKAWLRTEAKRGVPVSRWVALDDKPIRELGGALVLTTKEDGLTEAKAREVITRLCGEGAL